MPPAEITPTLISAMGMRLGDRKTRIYAPMCADDRADRSRAERRMYDLSRLRVCICVIGCLTSPVIYTQIAN